MNIRFQDTIAAPATIPGTGAISIIRISGSDAISVADKMIKLKSGTLNNSQSKLRYGLIYNDDNSLLDEVMVSIFKAPNSYTGEDLIEICCHASSYIVSEIMNFIVKSGIRIAEPGEFTQRAFINGKMDLTQAESVADLISANGKAAHNLAINQLRGGFSKELKELRDNLLNMTALMELELDFSEEDVEFADRSRLKELLSQVLGHIKKLVTSYKLGNAIKNGIPVIIAGPANAGKSTLLNGFLNEERAIVSDIEGTTRDTIEECVNIDGILFRFIDTAGIRQADNEIEKIGIDRTFKKLSQAQIVLALFDAGINDLDKSLQLIIDKTDKDNQNLIVLLNKIDKYNDVSEIKNRTEQLLKTNSIEAKVYTISAQDSKSVELISGILSEHIKGEIAEESQNMVTNFRHYQALSNAQTSLLRVETGLDNLVPTDLLAQDLREGLDYLGSILGEITNDEVLGHIFSHFCIGK